MDPRETMDDDQMDALDRAFAGQLLACLDECARGRPGLFGEAVNDDRGWPEAARLRELAVALQNIRAQRSECNALCNEFLELCSMHGESHPGERKLARMLLGRIERGEVGAPTQDENFRW